MNRYRLLLALVIAIGVVRIAATYAVFCETIDEPAHIGSGMEWLDRGTHRNFPIHPPLAHITGALGPYFAGIRFAATGNFVVDGNAVLYAGDRYVRNLSLCRAGILPFFVLGALVVAAWARRLWGDVGGLAAAALFTNEPSILAHSGIVSTDLAAAGTTVAAAYACSRWFDQNGAPKASVTFGVALGIAGLAKFSTLGFVPVAILAIVICRLLQKDGIRVPARSLLIAGSVAIAIVWAGYRFSFGTLASVNDDPQFQKVSIGVPAPELVHGFLVLRAITRQGHPSYLFGTFHQTGWWYYFPLSIALKTTIGFLLLLAAGIALLRRRDEQFFVRAAPIAAGLLILAILLPAKINIGIRHALPVYPFFAIAGGGAVAWLWARRHGRWIAGGLLGAAATASLAAHPDYLPYFNVMAGPRPDRIFVDSNLDWGQDLLRLARELERRGIQRVGLAYGGNAEPDRHGIRHFPLSPSRYTPGWVAISEVVLHSPGGQYRWLDRFEPVARVGKSIRLYHLPALEELGGAESIGPAGVTRILLPMWFEDLPGMAWSCELTIHNQGPRAVVLRASSGANAAVVLRIPQRATVENPSLRVGDARNGAVLYADSADVEFLHFALRVRSQSGQTLALPVLRQQQLASPEPFHFPDVPITPATQVTLRVYDVTGETNSVNVLVKDGGRSIPLTRQHASEAYPAAVTVGLNALFPQAGENAHVVVDPPSVLSWAFITVTDLKTGHTYVVLPN
jgi:4-amino-4-deoxy-L-arabinose transferase-like glycosyltransferase